MQIDQFYPIKWVLHITFVVLKHIQQSISYEFDIMTHQITIYPNQDAKKCFINKFPLDVHHANYNSLDSILPQCHPQKHVKSQCNPHLERLTRLRMLIQILVTFLAKIYRRSFPRKGYLREIEEIKNLNTKSVMPHMTRLQRILRDRQI